MIEKIKLLRKQTRASVLLCKKVLRDVKGNVILAKEKLLCLNESFIQNKLNHGLIASYIHNGSRLGVLVEVSCETDFVAKTLEFKILSQDIAMQIAANKNVLYVSEENMPILHGQKNRNDPTKVCLINQRFIKNTEVLVSDILKHYSLLFNEIISINRFSRFILGQR
uniref:Elongation factor Ts, chloroplastic n=1 Tax=Pterocladiophila hemisphaerica TaxID=2712948 RepID=A0A6M3WW95_9FLOR|nr:tsf [Pterocladiophila hemisphaerica]